MMMERKFRCVLFDGTIPLGAIVIEKKTPLGPMGLYNGEFMICHSNSPYARDHFEEITEPRIELKCVWFEEGEEFDIYDEDGIKACGGPYRVSANTVINKYGANLFADHCVGRLLDGIGRIELIPQPTEEDKQIAELKETIEEAMRKIEEIEKAREK